MVQGGAHSAAMPIPDRSSRDDAASQPRRCLPRRLRARLEYRDASTCAKVATRPTTDSGETRAPAKMWDGFRQTLLLGKSAATLPEDLADFLYAVRTGGGQR